MKSEKRKSLRDEERFFQMNMVPKLLVSVAFFHFSWDIMGKFEVDMINILIKEIAARKVDEASEFKFILYLFIFTYTIKPRYYLFYDHTSFQDHFLSPKTGWVGWV